MGDSLPAPKSLAWWGPWPEGSSRRTPACAQTAGSPVGHPVARRGCSRTGAVLAPAPSIAASSHTPTSLPQLLPQTIRRGWGGLLRPPTLARSPLHLSPPTEAARPAAGQALRQAARCSICLLLLIYILPAHWHRLTALSAFGTGNLPTAGPGPVLQQVPRLCTVSSWQVHSQEPSPQARGRGHLLLLTNLTVFLE